MADLKPVYLVCGDDDAKIDAWRTRVRKRAEVENGQGGLESFDARLAAPDEIVASLAALTFATGTRYVLVDDVGAWKAGELPPLLDAIAALPPDTVLVLVVRGKPLKGLVQAVEKAGGEVREHPAPKPWELPKWASGRARELGLRLEGEAAKTLVALAGPSQQRISRELEKLAIALHPDPTAGVEDVERLTAGEASPRVYDLGDALVGGNVEQAIELAEELALQGERPSRFVYPIVGRLREVHRAVELLEGGLTEKELAGALKLPPWRVKKIVPLARRADREALERALCRFADLEVELRGGGSLDEETAVTLTLARAAA
ncbi:MAG TPA: DNA polymerase III subunit delta [Thermoleophilaceae bacterium]|nr:DNA polymerase III subunit delta [Thermoleophilaceae bacterium]